MSEIGFHRRLYDKTSIWMAAVGLALMLFAPAARSQVSYEAGTRSFEGPIATVKLDNLRPDGDASTAAKPAPPPSGDLSESSEYRALKRRAGVPTPIHPGQTPLAPPAASDAAAPQTPFPHYRFGGNHQEEYSKHRCGDPSASDMALAVGDDSSEHPVLQVNNKCIALFKKNGSPRPGYPKRLDALFNPGNNLDIFDPRALYDWANRRYVIVATEEGGSEGHYWIAVSKGNNSADDYFVYRLPMPSGGQGYFADFPRLGQDRNAIYIATNKYSNSPKRFQYEEWLVLPKASLYRGTAPLQYKYVYDIKVDGVLTDTSQPANVWNPADNPGAAFFVASRNPNIKSDRNQCPNQVCNGLFVYSLVDPGSDKKPVVSGVTVRTAHDYALPPDPKQGKSGHQIDAGDTRLSGQVSYVNGALYPALTTKNNSGGAAVLLFTLQPTLRNGAIDSVTITDEALVDYGQNSAFYPTTQPDLKGNTLTVFSLAGPDYYPSTAYVVRRPKTLPDGGAILAQGYSAYGNQRGWGDYTAVAPDLSPGKYPAIWFSGEFTWGPTEGLFSHLWYTIIGIVDFELGGRP